MRGFPKYADIATKEDVENLKQLFPKETCEFLKQLVEDTFIWEDAGELVRPEDGLDDSTHQIIPVQEGEKIVSYRQLVLVDDPNSRMHRMGYNLAQITELVNQLSTEGEDNGKTKRSDRVTRSKDTASV